MSDPSTHAPHRRRRFPLATRRHFLASDQRALVCEAVETFLFGYDTVEQDSTMPEHASAPDTPAACAIPFCGESDTSLVVVCENGHAMHALCLRRMADTVSFAGLLCPLCRSDLMGRAALHALAPLHVLSLVRPLMMADSRAAGRVLMLVQHEIAAGHT
jgi:hypothetical protein